MVMRIHVRAVGFLRQYTNKNLQVIEIEMPEDSTVKELLFRLQIPEGEVLRVAVNGKLVPFDHLLQDEDEVRIIPPFGGG